MTDQELADIAITLGSPDPEWLKRRPPGSQFVLRTMLIGLLFSASIILAFLAPARPDIPSLFPFSATIAVGCGFGRQVGWCIFATSALWLVWVVPPANSIAVDLEYLPWVAEVLLTWLAIPAVAAGYRRGPLYRRNAASTRASVSSSSDTL